MKIEKINDNQIKCTLNKSDLASREIKISELAYGTEKAKNLFRDMMQQAAYEFGFEAEDIPLMIEAIPVSADCIILVITKVEDPEELDTRFSKFAPDTDDLEDMEDSDFEIIEEDFIPLPEALAAGKKDTNSMLSSTDKSLPSEKNTSHSSQENGADTQNLKKTYSFYVLDDIIHLSNILKELYYGINSLYKSDLDKKYYLVITQSDLSPETFHKVCNILSEYGTQERSSYAQEAYFKEHFKPIIANSALQKLALL